MSILTNEAIFKEIDKGNIIIKPFNPDNIGPASIDLHLGNYFRRFSHTHKVLPIKDDVDYKIYTEKIFVSDEEGLILLPNETVLAITREHLTTASHIGGWLEGRSRFARLGLLVHVSASFMQPGLSNKQVLEIMNCSGRALELYPGTKICQFIFQYCSGSAVYQGQFATQDEDNF